jgi:hypothetical protein
MAARFQQLAGAAVWWVLIVCRWGHATFVALPMNFFLDTVLANYEEAVKSAVREAFSWTARFLNGVAARVSFLLRTCMRNMLLFPPWLATTASVAALPSVPRPGRRWRCLLIQTITTPCALADGGLRLGR